MQEKRAAREEAKAIEMKVTLPTFEQCAETYTREHWPTWSKKHRDQWPSSLKRHGYQTIGKLAIPEIKPSHIDELVRPIWVEKRETSKRVSGRIETIISKNADVDEADFRNPAELTSQLREKLPRRPKRVVRHHPVLLYAEAPQFMARLYLSRRRRGVDAPLSDFHGIIGCSTRTEALMFAATKAQDSGYSISFHSSIPRRALTIVKMLFRHPCASMVACERFWLSTLKLSLLSKAASTPLHLAGGPEDEAELHGTQPTPATRSCREFRAYEGPDHELRSGKWGEIVLSIAFGLNDLLRTNPTASPRKQTPAG